ncbi:MAG: nicotinate phosphoribosyltransferase [Deltaproteobacteria bacterium]
MDRSGLFVDLYELTMSQCYFHARRGRTATFDLFVRGLPPSRRYLVFAGLPGALEYVRSLGFSKDDIAYLRSLGLFTGDFLAYLRALTFTGDVWAMPEGSLFFPNEPVMRVTADIIQAQILESCLLNTVNVQTMLASKAARIVEAARGREVYDFSLRRTHGSDAAMKAARSSYIAGFAGTSNVLAGMQYGIPVAGTMAHSFVMSFPTEQESFSTYARQFPEKTVLLVDTYDTAAGIRNAVRTGRALKKDGHVLRGIRLDSGDLVRLSRMARTILDRAGLRDTKIMASGNLDEHSIARILREGAAVDSFGVGTHMGASVDAPALDLIYKLSEVSDARGRAFPTMKLSKGKVTYPGRKQVFRLTDRMGYPVRDIIGLENEKLPGRRMLEKVVEKGRLVRRLPPLSDVRGEATAALRSLPYALRKIGPASAASYPVRVSPGLAALTGKLSESLERRQ